MSWKISNNNWDIQMLINNRSQIDLRPEYQRQLVWNPALKQHLIWCMLRGQDIPKFYFHIRKDVRPRRWDVIDGQQRVDAILSYIDNEFALSTRQKPDGSKLAAPINDYSVAGYRFADLPPDLQDTFLSYPIVVTEIETDDKERVIDQFLALQFGKSLNNQEKRHARPGFLRDLILELGDHNFVDKVAKVTNKKRYGQYEAVSRLVLWELNDRIIDSSSEQLDKIYIQNAEVDKTFKPLPHQKENWGQIKNRMTTALNLLENIFESSHPTFKSVGMFSLLYWLARHVNSVYVINPPLVDAIRDWFFNFCDEMQEEIKKWSSGTSGGRINRQRYYIMLHHFYENLPGSILIEKDSKRSFTQDERDLIWHRARGMCQWEQDDQLCGFPLKYEDNWDADHIIRHRDGGKTTMANGRLLCPYRNRSQHSFSPCPIRNKTEI
jgi:hypothetical protein